MRGSAGRIMIRPGQAIMIAWLTTAHAPLWEPAHERATPKKSRQLRKDLLGGRWFCYLRPTRVRS